MALTYSVFAAKYGDRIPSLTESKFNAFLPDVLAEVSRYEWGGLLDKATGLLLAHEIVIADPSSSLTYEGSAVTSVRIEGEVSFGLADSSKLEGYSASPFGKEYARLLASIGGGAGKVASGHFGGNRVDRSPQVWG